MGWLTKAWSWLVDFWARFDLKALLFVLRLFALVRPRLDISPGGKPYLIRWYLGPTGEGKFSKWWRQHMPGVFLHCFVSSDPDRGWHSHPWWWAWSLILEGSYIESRPGEYDLGFQEYKGEERIYIPGDTNHLLKDDFHRVKLVTPRVWTLFIVGPLHGEEWDFMTEDGTIQPHGTDTPGD